MSQACSIRPSNVQRYLDHEFSVVTVEHGKQYFADSKVTGLRVTKTGLFAAVQGTQTYAISIEYNPDTDGIRTDCSCSVGYACKHAVATLMTYADSARATQSLENASVTALKRQIEEWTSDVQHTLALAISGANPSEPKTVDIKPKQLTRTEEDLDIIAYLLNEGWSYEKGRTPIWGHVERVHSRLLKRGAFAKPRPQQELSDWEHIRNLARFGGADVDVEIAVHVATHISVHPHDFRTLTLDGDSTLLTMLLNSGRLFCADHHQAGPLRLSQPRVGKLTWEPETDELLPRLRVAGQMLALIPVEPLHFIDMDTMQCGPIDIDCPASVALAFLRSPPTTSATHPMVRGALLKAASKFDIPLPPSNGQPDLIAIEPSPVLRLTYRRPPSDEAPQAPNVDRTLYGALSFRYDNMEIELGDPTMTVNPGMGNLDTHYLRDRAFESDSRHTLKAHGFEQAPDIDDLYGLPSLYLPHDETSDVFRDFTFTGIEELREQGWHVEIGEDYPHQQIKVDDWYLGVSGDAHKTGWFDLELGIEIEGAQHNLLPIFLEALRSKDLDHFLSDRAESALQLEISPGKFVRVPRDRLRTLTDVLLELHRKRTLDDERLRLNTFRLGQVVSLGRQDDQTFSVVGDKSLVEWGENLVDFDGMKEPFVPSSFNGNLRSYQSKGLAWLQFLSDYRLSGLLADDMGLGKTLQVLCFIKGERERCRNNGKSFRPSLVVAPTSVVHNWKNEARRFFSEFDVFVHHGETRLPDANAANSHEIVVTSYALLVRDLDLFKSVPFHAVVLDEAQAIKNPRTRAHESICQIEAHIRLALSGTPVENHLGELWSQFAFLLPGLLSNQTDFRRQFRSPIEKYGDTLRMDALRSRVRPFVLRRLKSDVEKDLPEKTEIIKSVELVGEQRDLYETVRLAMDKRVRELLKAKGLAKSSIEILDALLKLRQVCCHPGLLPPDTSKGVHTSAKLDDLMEVLEKLHAESRRVLVFSQFTSMLALIEKELVERGVDYLKLTGATRKRQQLIDKFQRGDIPVFLISLKAGGTGLTLTAADTVIHFDPWWNPAVENQATDRTHRIGQTHPVFVYKMICRDTVEEKIVELQKKKGALASSLLEGKGGLRGFTTEDVRHLFE